RPLPGPVPVEAGRKDVRGDTNRAGSAVHQYDLYLGCALPETALRVDGRQLGEAVMKDEDIQNLLGGFATDTLTDRERELLFTASLTKQELFNALADDQALRELLSDPAARRQLLQALQPSQPGFFERLTGWMRRPATWAVAGSVTAALVVAIA